MPEPMDNPFVAGAADSFVRELPGFQQIKMLADSGDKQAAAYLSALGFGQGDVGAVARTAERPAFTRIPGPAPIPPMVPPNLPPMARPVLSEEAAARIALQRDNPNQPFPHLAGPAADFGDVPTNSEVWSRLDLEAPKSRRPRRGFDSRQMGAGPMLPFHIAATRAKHQYDRRFGEVDPVDPSMLPARNQGPFDYPPPSPTPAEAAINPFTGQPVQSAGVPLPAERPFPFAPAGPEAQAVQPANTAGHRVFEIKNPPGNAVLKLPHPKPERTNRQPGMTPASLLQQPQQADNGEWTGDDWLQFGARMLQAGSQGDSFAGALGAGLGAAGQSRKGRRAAQAEAAVENRKLAMELVKLQSINALRERELEARVADREASREQRAIAQRQLAEHRASSLALRSAVAQGNLDVRAMLVEQRELDRRSRETDAIAKFEAKTRGSMQEAAFGQPWTDDQETQVEDRIMAAYPGSERAQAIASERSASLKAELAAQVAEVENSTLPEETKRATVAKMRKLNAELQRRLGVHFRQQ